MIVISCNNAIQAGIGVDAPPPHGIGTAAAAALTQCKECLKLVEGTRQIAQDAGPVAHPKDALQLATHIAKKINC